jgi:hypothetical protein
MYIEPIDYLTENRELREENQKLKAKLYTMQTKDIIVLPIMKCVDCPMESHIMLIRQCASCDYCKTKMILEFGSGILEYVYCAYKERRFIDGKI